MASPRTRASRRLGRPLEQGVVAILDRQHATLPLLLGHAVAGPAAGLILRSGLHPVIADLQRAGPLVGHVAVRARDPGAGGHALTPDLELRVLRLQHLVPGLGVDPVRDILRVVVGLDLEREGVAREDPLEPRIPVELLLAGPASLARARGPRTWW
jgi:hypothetical protein